MNLAALMSAIHSYIPVASSISYLGGGPFAFGYTQDSPIHKYRRRWGRHGGILS
jgi:hypothetical protein